MDSTKPAEKRELPPDPPDPPDPGKVEFGCVADSQDVAPATPPTEISDGSARPIVRPVPKLKDRTGNVWLPAAHKLAGKLGINLDPASPAESPPSPTTSEGSA
jgi:hypothetical protein